MPHILALDQGTTSSRAILFSHAGTITASHQIEFPQLFPHPGWVEHNPADIWQSQRAAAHAVIAAANIPPTDIAAIAIANQRETTLLWDRSTGLPLANAIVWQDRRTAPLCDELKRAGHADLIQQKTGLVLDAYFSATKLRWLLDNLPNARDRALRGELAFGTVDSWLLFNLTQRRTHATDPSNASRTMLFNIHTNTWDEDLLQLFNIPRPLLPEIRPSSSLFAETTLFGPSIPIAGIAGDQQAALFGQTCFHPGLAKNTYGTGCFMLMNTGHTPIPSKHKLLTTTAWDLSPQSKIENQKLKISYALEGSVFIGGAVVQWLRDGLGILKSTADIEPLAASVPDTAGVYLVPAFAGLGAPHWDQYARGSIAGLTRGTTAAHIARAALESIAYQVADVLDVMKQDAALEIKELRADGGAATNNLLLQFQSDLLRIPVVRPQITETTALGAAYLAGLAVNFWNSPADIESHWKIDRRFHPQMPLAESTRRRLRWSEALRRSLDWAEQ